MISEISENTLKTKTQSKISYENKRKRKRKKSPVEKLKNGILLRGPFSCLTYGI